MNGITIVALSTVIFLLLCYITVWVTHHTLRWSRGLPSVFNNAFDVWDNEENNSDK